MFIAKWWDIVQKLCISSLEFPCTYVSRTSIFSANTEKLFQWGVWYSDSTNHRVNSVHWAALVYGSTMHKQIWFRNTESFTFVQCPSTNCLSNYLKIMELVVLMLFKTSVWELWEGKKRTKPKQKPDCQPPFFVYFPFLFRVL